MGHSLQWRKAKPLVQRREDKHLGRIVENAEYLDRNKAEKSHVVLHTAANHGTAQVGVAREIVADDDQLQVVVERLFFQLCFQGRECLDDPHHILMRTDSAGIQDEGVVDLVPLSDELVIGGTGMTATKTIINGVVHHFDFLSRNAEQLLDIFLREVGNREDPVGAAKDSPGEVKMRGLPYCGAISAGQVFEHVVHGHHVRTWQGTWEPEQMRDVHNVAFQACQQIAESEIAADGFGVGEKRDSTKIRGKGPYFPDPFRRAHHEVRVVAINAAQRPNDVANISSDTKI